MIKVDEYNNVCVLGLSGDLTGPEAQLMRKLAEDVVDKRQLIDFVVDFEKASFVDSEGLEALLWLKRRCEDLFGQMKVANLDENVRKILEITRLGQRFDCPGDLATALKNIR